jgi:hypothetical protein
VKRRTVFVACRNGVPLGAECSPQFEQQETAAALDNNRH